jgi:hypothetical protein
MSIRIVLPTLHPIIREHPGTALPAREEGSM